MCACVRVCVQVRARASERRSCQHAQHGHLSQGGADTATSPYTYKPRTTVTLPHNHTHTTHEQLGRQPGSLIRETHARHQAPRLRPPHRSPSLPPPFPPSPSPSLSFTQPSTPLTLTLHSPPCVCSRPPSLPLSRMAWDMASWQAQALSTQQQRPL